MQQKAEIPLILSVHSLRSKGTDDTNKEHVVRKEVEGAVQIYRTAEMHLFLTDESGA